MSNLFEPVTIGSMELRNKVVRSATWDNTPDSSGAVTDESVALFKKLGRGRIGLIITGHTFVSVLGQATTGQYGIHQDDMISGLRRLVEAAHQEGSKIAVQLTHCGISSSYLRGQGIPVQVVSRRESLEAPQKELTDLEIEAIVSDFASAARRALEAGFDAIQLHGTHGYLMSQFLSPLSNRREDLWGRSADGRRRFHMEVIKGIRQTIGNTFPLLIKFGVQEDREGGLPLSEGIETARQMVQQGINAIEISGADSRGAIPKLGENDPEQTPFRGGAAAVRKAVTVPIILVGGIRSLDTARNILERGDADLVSMCRPFIREPGLVVRWQKDDSGPANCISCNKCMPTGNIPTSCKEESRLREEAANFIEEHKEK